MSSARWVPVISSPVIDSLIWSTPRSMSLRTALRMPSGPSANLVMRLDQRAAGDGDLRAVGQVAGAGDAAGVDGVAADHVEPVLGRGGAQAHGVAGVDVGAGGLEAEQQVFLDRHGAQAVEVGGVVPGEVGVRVAQPGHQGAAAALDHPGAFGLAGVDGADGGDAVVVDQDVTGVGVGAGGVEDRRRCGTGSWWSGQACRAFLCAEVQRAVGLEELRSRSVTGPAASSAVQCPTPGKISTVAWPCAPGDLLAGLGWADLVVGAGDQQQRQLGGDRARVGGGGERLAVAGVALRVLAHDAARGRTRPPRACPAGWSRTARWPPPPVRRRPVPFSRSDRGPVALGLPPGLGGLADRAEQGQRGHLVRVPGGQLPHHERAHRVPDHAGRRRHRARRGRRPGRRRGRSMLMSSVTGERPAPAESTRITRSRSARASVCGW